MTWRIVRAALWICAAMGMLLALAWPMVVGGDPADPTYRVLALAAFWGFLAAVVALVARKARRAARGWS